MGLPDCLSWREYALKYDCELEEALNFGVLVPSVVERRKIEKEFYEREQAAAEEDRQRLQEKHAIQRAHRETQSLPVGSDEQSRNGETTDKEPGEVHTTTIDTQLETQPTAVQQQPAIQQHDTLSSVASAHDHVLIEGILYHVYQIPYGRAGKPSFRLV